MCYCHIERFTREMTWVPNRIKKFGQTFFTEVLRTEYGNRIFWIYFLGSENEAKNYYYNITMGNSDDEQVQSMYGGQVISMRQDRVAILKNPKGLILSDAMVKNFLEDDGLMFEITMSVVNRPSFFVANWKKGERKRRKT
jgi:hypothetical protein